MATTAREKVPDLPEERPPDWSPVAPRGRGRRGVLAGVILRAGAAALVAGLLWWFGHRLAGTVLLAVMALAIVAAVVSPALAERMDRVAHTVERVAGRGLNFVLLGAVQLLVFAPVWALMRLLRHDPLALGARADSPTLWRHSPHKPGTPLDARPFAYERFPAPGALAGEPARRGRLRVALALIAAVLILDVGIGAALHAVDKTGENAASAMQRSLLLDPNIAAARGEPWLGDLASEVDRVWYGKRFHPQLGWTLPDIDGSQLHVSGGIRRSYQGSGSGSDDALEVFFFGGSTMFGLYQRDDHTIPSEIARLAEADGIDLRVFNYGRMAYNNWQEVLLLEEIVSRRPPPDLAVFYDGANELVGQFRLGPHTEPTHQESAEFARRIGLDGDTPDDQGRSSLGTLFSAWKNVSAAGWLSRRVRGRATEEVPSTQPLTAVWAGEQAELAPAAGANAATLHARGARVAERLGDGFGFRTAAFWQPFLYSKPVAAGEQTALGALGTDPGAWTQANERARAGLSSAVSDLGDSLDPVDRPVMLDFVHTNELGARVVARAMYRELRPQLEELAARSRE